MGDKIVVMNHGVIEQFGAPQDIYDKPATMFVAEFIGSPPMNFLRHHGLHRGRGRRGRPSAVTASGCRRRASPSTATSCSGVRPEHVRFRDDGDYRGEVLAAEYLGTTQIVTLATPLGEVKARTPSGQVARVGETVGARFQPQNRHALRRAVGPGASV